MRPLAPGGSELLGGKGRAATLAPSFVLARWEPFHGKTGAGPLVDVVPARIFRGNVFHHDGYEQLTINDQHTNTHSCTYTHKRVMK